ncbi:CDP-diacylglycerol--glycerol-3-phosphate 3-phosphatidyltransferase [uncultured Desulfovibrio sp.]|uniref:CDP-diacylglycerol--glycerol-3-phosphate 3-phosphatidyltransferase n=1 Tax=uncultured Desulfovibrio sp. TaxID=167968 RepID=UPI002628A239|nr:CDP-diacylglycerol--glycerol-3-phosphate 3-phosphatidyltransferase [uncultured Desulfovibrio sp.]
MNLANKITLLRILMVPLIIVLLYFEGPVFCFLAALAFAFASLTDWVDGYIARRRNMVTSMGKFLDPLADKVLVCSVLIMFVHLQWAPAWVVIVMVCRELIVTGLRAIARDEGIVLAADKFGKAKTVLQICAIIPMTLHYPYWGHELWRVGEWLLYLAMLMAIFSCINYCVGFYGKQRKQTSAAAEELHTDDPRA